MFFPFQTLGQKPWERFTTTYSGDYKPFSERPLQVNQLNPRTEAKPDPALVNPPQVRQINEQTNNKKHGQTFLIDI